MDADNLPQIGSMLASVGFAVWCAWHFISHTLPALMAQHAVERREMMVGFGANLDKIAAHCEKELQVISARNEQVLQMISARNKEELQAIVAGMKHG